MSWTHCLKNIKDLKASMSLNVPDQPCLGPQSLTPTLRHWLKLSPVPLFPLAMAQAQPCLWLDMDVARQTLTWGLLSSAHHHGICLSDVGLVLTLTSRLASWLHLGPASLPPYYLMICAVTLDGEAPVLAPRLPIPRGAVAFAAPWQRGYSWLRPVVFERYVFWCIAQSSADSHFLALHIYVWSKGYFTIT